MKPLPTTSPLDRLRIHRVFVYGTLLDSDTRKKVWGHDVSRATAQLAGWTRRVGHTYPYLERDEDGVVRGMVLYLTFAERLKLDKWEARYHRMKVTLTNGMSAETYEIAGH